MSPEDEMKRALGSLFDSGEYSDLTLICRGEKFNLHKAVVCPRSEFFRRACKEKGFLEGETGEIRLSSDEDDYLRMDDPTLVRFMLEYLYKLDYLPAPQGSIASPSRLSGWDNKDRRPRRVSFRQGLTAASNNDDSSSSSNLKGEVQAHVNPITHAQMYAYGDYYGIQGLQHLAHQKFELAMASSWNSVEFIESILVVTHSVPPTDTTLQRSIANAITDHRSLLDKPEIEAILSQTPALTFALLKRQNKAFGQERKDAAQA